MLDANLACSSPGDEAGGAKTNAASPSAKGTRLRRKRKEKVPQAMIRRSRRDAAPVHAFSETTRRCVRPAVAMPTSLGGGIGCAPGR